MEKISVIVPVYKVEDYLNRCVASIVGQTYENLEIILVDDGSPDRCGTMCDAWAEKDSRVRVIHKENGGLSDARNAGMDTATGELLGFVDSDDWLETDFYEVLKSAMDETGAEIAGCSYQEVVDGQQERKDDQSIEYRVCSSQEALEELIYGRNFRAVAWNKLYRKALFADVRFPKGRYHEDEFVAYRLMDAAEKLVYIDRELYYYRQRNASIMTTITPKHLDALDAYLLRLALLEEKYPALYRQDKVNFCKACVMFYRTVLQEDAAHRQVYLEKIRQCREKITFTRDELKGYTRKERLYIRGSGRLLHVFAKLLNAREDV